MKLHCQNLVIGVKWTLLIRGTLGLENRLKWENISKVRSPESSIKLNVKTCQSKTIKGDRKTDENRNRGIAQRG